MQKSIQCNLTSRKLLTPNLVKSPDTYRGFKKAVIIQKKIKEPDSTRTILKHIRSPLKPIIDLKTPKGPYRPTNLPKEIERLLTYYEKKEILKFDLVYYVRKQPLKQPIYQLDPIYFIFNNGENIMFRYEQISELGRGSFGCVLKCLDHKTGKYVAVKCIKDTPIINKQISFEQKVLDFMKRDVNSIKKHCARVFETHYYGGFFFFVTELYDKSLLKTLKMNNFQGFELQRVKLITKQVTMALQYIHSHGFVHCDLKPDNILWTSDRHQSVKLIDFGCACMSNKPMYSYIQSRYYRAPEVMLGYKYNQQIDMWSLGCVMFELLTGSVLFKGSSEKEQVEILVGALGYPNTRQLEGCKKHSDYFNDDGELISKSPNLEVKTLTEILQPYDEVFGDFVIKCLTWSAMERMTSSDALKHPFISDV